MYEFTCAFCGKIARAEGNKQRRKYCGSSCSGKAARGVKPYTVDLDFDWKQLPLERETYECRYNEGVACTDRNCSACGFNPAVAQKRIDAIRKRMKEGKHGAEWISEEAG